MNRTVLSSLVVCLFGPGWCAADDPLRPGDLFAAPWDREASRRAFLESCRRHQAHLRETIAWQEKLLTDFRGAFTPERMHRFKKSLEEDREDLKKWEKVVQELERYEQERNLKPGPETDAAALTRLRKLHQELWPPPSVAPMPREKK